MGHPTSQNLATGKARQPWLKAVRYASSSATSEFELPPVLYIQGTSDVAHPRADRDRILESYPKAGGRVDLDLYEGEGEAFITRNPTSPAIPHALNRIISFVHAELR